MSEVIIESAPAIAAAAPVLSREAIEACDLAMDSLVGASALLRLASDMDPPALDPDCAMGVHCLLLSAKQGFDRFVMGLPKELRFDHPLQGPAFLTPLCQALRIAERASRDECPKSGGLDFGEIELLRELVERVQGEASKFDVPRQ